MKVNAKNATDLRFLPNFSMAWMRSAIANGAANQSPTGLKDADRSAPLAIEYKIASITTSRVLKSSDQYWRRAHIDL